MTVSLTKRPLLAAFGLVALLGLAGCDLPPARGKLDHDALSADPGPDAQWHPIKRTESLLIFSGGNNPAAISAMERRYHNTVSHRVILANRSVVPGENYAMLELFGDRNRGATGWGNPPPFISMPKVSEKAIQNRLKSEFPVGLAPDIAVEVPRNAYGPYGYVLMRDGTGRAHCIYAWQQVSKNEKVLPSSIEGMILEFRYCDPKLNEMSARALFERISIRIESGILPAYRDAVTGNFATSAPDPYDVSGYTYDGDDVTFGTPTRIPSAEPAAQPAPRRPRREVIGGGEVIPRSGASRSTSSTATESSGGVNMPGTMGTDYGSLMDP